MTGILLVLAVAFFAQPDASAGRLPIGGFDGTQLRAKNGSLFSTICARAMMSTEGPFRIPDIRQDFYPFQRFNFGSRMFPVYYIWGLDVHVQRDTVVLLPQLILENHEFSTIAAIGRASLESLTALSEPIGGIAAFTHHNFEARSKGGKYDQWVRYANDIAEWTSEHFTQYGAIVIRDPSTFEIQAVARVEINSFWFDPLARSDNGFINNAPEGFPSFQPSTFHDGAGISILNSGFKIHDIPFPKNLFTFEHEGRQLEVGTALVVGGFSFNPTLNEAGRKRALAQIYSVILALMDQRARDADRGIDIVTLMADRSAQRIWEQVGFVATSAKAEDSNQIERVLLAATPDQMRGTILDRVAAQAGVSSESIRIRAAHWGGRFNLRARELDQSLKEDPQERNGFDRAMDLMDGMKKLGALVGVEGIADLLAAIHDAKKEDKP